MAHKGQSDWMRVEPSTPPDRDRAEQELPRVILADDEIFVRVLMRKVMTSMKCEIVGEAKDGQEAIDLFREKKPDLLLLDINMPVKTGEEALREISREFPNACVIMLTSLADMESVENCLNFGAANYIRKDTPLGEMKKIIRETWIAFH